MRMKDDIQYLHGNAISPDIEMDPCVVLVRSGHERKVKAAPFGIDLDH